MHTCQHTRTLISSGLTIRIVPRMLSSTLVPPPSQATRRRHACNSQPPKEATRCHKTSGAFPNSSHLSMVYVGSQRFFLARCFSTWIPKAAPSMQLSAVQHLMSSASLLSRMARSSPILPFSSIRTPRLTLTRPTSHVGSQRSKSAEFTLVSTSLKSPSA